MATRPRTSRSSDPHERARRKLYAHVSERDFQAQMIELLRLRGYLVFHDPDARRCRHCGQMQRDKRVPGFPDLFAVKRPEQGSRLPLVLLVELKTERGVLSTEQQAWGVYLALAAKMLPGFYYGVWRPGDYPAILRLLGASGEESAA